MNDTKEMQPATSLMDRPQAGEHDPYYDRYISLVPDGNIIEILSNQIGDTVDLLATVSEDQAGRSYAPGKWTVKEVVGHLSDAERIFAYRMLRIGRGDKTPIEGFDQDPYVQDGPFRDSQCTLASLVDEFKSVRQATLQLLKHFGSEAWMRRGVANQLEITVRSLAYTTAGHELHHRRILRERYL